MLKKLKTIDLFGDTVPLQILIFPHEYIIPLLVAIIVLRGLKYYKDLKMAKILLEKSYEGINENGDAYRCTEKYRP